MKKQWKSVMLLTTLCVAAGCNNDSNEPETPGDDLVPTLRDVQQVEGVVGRGYDLTGKYADASWVKAPVLDYNALATAELIDHPNGTNTEYHTSSGANVNAYQESLEQKAGVKAGGGIGAASFSAGVKFTFDSKQTETNDYAFGTYSVRVPKRSTKVLLSDGSLLLQYRSTAFLGHLQTMTAAQLVETYGTHVMLGGVWGGRCDYNMSSKKKAGQTEASIGRYVEASAKYGLFSAEASASEVSSSATSFETTTTSSSVFIVGGDVSIGAAINANVGYTKFTEWVQSIKGDDIHWIDFFAPNGLVLLADFVEANPAEGLTKAQVQTAIQNYYADKGLSYDPSKVSELVETNGNANTQVENIGGLRQENLQGDGDIDSKGGNYTDWEVKITITGRHTKQMQGQVEYRVKELGGIDAHAHLTQLVGDYNFTIDIEHTIEHFGSRDGFTVSSDGNSVTLSGSGRINGRNHDWNNVPVSGLTNVQVKIDDSGSDKGNCGIKFDISVPYKYLQ